MPDEEFFDTMGYGMLEAMTLVLDVGGYMKCMMKLNLYMMPFQKILEITIHMDP